MSRYYNDRLGLLWALINPMLKALIYFAVFKYLLGHTEKNYALFIFCGIITWSAFAEASKSSMNILKKKRYLMENIQFEWFDLYISHVISVFKGYLFNFAAFGLLCMIFQVRPGFEIIYFPIVLISLMMFCLGVSLVLSVVFPFIQDLHHIWDMFLLVGFWGSGIFFNPLVIVEKLPVAIVLNPLIGIVHNLRSMFLTENQFDESWMIINLAFSVFVASAGYLFYKSIVHRANENI